MQENKTKFKENISLEYYYMIYVEKTKDPSLRAVIVKWAKELRASPQWDFEKCPLREIACWQKFSSIALISGGCDSRTQLYFIIFRNI